MENIVIYFEKYCKNCGCIKQFKRTEYANGKSCQRCVDCEKASKKKSRSKPDAKERTRIYGQQRKAKLHELGIVKPRQGVVLPAVYNEQGQKRCNKCFEFKDETIHFASRGGGKYKTQCKACRNKQTLANLKANQERLEKKREYDRVRVKTVAKEANKLSCRKYQDKLRPIKQRESLERQLLKELSCIAYWYKCKHCNVLKYSKRSNKNRDVCNSCKHIGRTFTVKPKKAICPICNKQHIAKHKNAMCFECVNHSKRLLRNIYGAKRKAKIRKATIAHKVDPLYIFKRDKYKCKFCGVKVQKQDVYADNAAEIDHIIPISKGGHHAYYNCQTLCRKCNQSKSNKLLGQLLLAI